MDAHKYLEIISLAERLKNNTRHSWTSQGRHESVAEHSWRMTLMAFFLRDEFPQADMDKVMKMCLVHDMGEAFTGDIPSFDKTKAHEQREAKLLADWVESLPQPYREELSALYAEMDELETLEAKIYKALDKLEVIHQHNEADLSTWLPLERELNLTYGTENVVFSPYLTELRQLMRRESEEKLEAGEMIRIVSLDESYRGKELEFRYQSGYYYDISAQEGPGGFSFSLERKAFDQPVEKRFTDTLFSDWLEDPQLYGAEVDGVIRGYLELDHEKWNNRMRVTNLLVEEGFRRQGIGELLMAKAVERGESAGARALVLETQSCNDRAIRFYRKNGFSLIGFDLTAYSQTDVQKKEVRLEMARPISGQTKQ